MNRLTPVFLCGLLFLWIGVIKAADDTFLMRLQETMPLYFDHPQVGITDPLLNQAAHALWGEVIKQGYAITPHKTDKEARTIFGQIQLHSEQSMLALLKSKPEKSIVKAVWIIHAPLISTALVSQGIASAHLVSPEILADQDKTRLKNSLDRAAVMREFLERGGVIIAAYQEDKREGENGRSVEQIAIFDALKKRYPQQLIEFAIDPLFLPNQQYPVDKIGATCLVETSPGNVFEITTRGVQINKTAPWATWGVWLQARNHPHTEVTQRLCTIFHFLKQAGLEEALARQMAPSTVLSIIKPYLDTTGTERNLCRSG